QSTRCPPTSSTRCCRPKMPISTTIPASTGAASRAQAGMCSSPAATRAAAASYYYGKTLDQLTIAQCAAIASTFQLPSVVNPLNSPPRLLARRNWVLGEMLKHRYITEAQYQAAIAEPNDAAPHEAPIQVDAPYLAEMVRR